MRSNRLKNTPTTLLGIFAASIVLIGLSACNTGKTNPKAVTFQDAIMAKDIAINNASIIFPLQTRGDKPSAKLRFVLTNTNPATTDQLIAITATDGGTVKLSGDTVIKGLRSLYAPTTPPSSAVENPAVVDATIFDSAENLKPGLTVSLTFVFKNNGSVVVNVPILQGADTSHTFKQQEFGDNSEGSTENEGESK